MDVHYVCYGHEDPCVDGYYSFRHQHAIFGARRNTPTGLELDVITQSHSLNSSDGELGAALLRELALTPVAVGVDSPLLTEIGSGRYRPNKMTVGLSLEEFADSYFPFGVWTKQGDVPLIIGAMLCDLYPASLNRRPIPKSSTAGQLGAAVKRFLEELSGYLKKSGMADRPIRDSILTSLRARN